MTRRKLEETQRLTRKITIRVPDPFFKKMESWLANTNCQTIAELARCMVCKEQVIWYHKDASLESVAQELSAIRKELNAIGKNINQITHAFHDKEFPDQKLDQAIRVAEEYRKVGSKVDQLLSMTSEIVKTWLQK